MYKLLPLSLKNFLQSFIRKKDIFIHRGKQVKCPLCNSEFKRFKSYNGRKNARCWNCESLERHRLLWLYINEKMFIPPHKVRLLHVAPEKVFYQIFSVNENIDYYPCDLNPENYYHTGKVKIIKADITDIHFDDHFFDIIICNHVLEHIPNDLKAMKELFRVMKQGGMGVFQVPIDYSREITFEDFSITTPEGRIEAYGLPDHFRIYGHDYIDRLATAGFMVTEDNYASTLNPADLLKYGINVSEMIYIGRKSKNFL